MRIAVSVSLSSLDAPVDPRFGRARYFLLIDPATLAWEAVDNAQNLDLSQGAGIQAAQNLLRHDVQVLLTGNCGPKAFKVLKAAGIKVCVGVTGSAREAVHSYLEGRCPPSEGPNVEGHWI
jgi:predicted Fe-Mo cluster-binding NifX family protein